MAIVKRVQEVIPDKKLIGYDIGCAFKKTIGRSSIGPSLQARFVIPSMHGYAHNRACQLGHHPNYVPGTGLEDFETCERVFSASNECARLTRHATKFHRHQSIDAHFHQWDQDKYASLGSFLRNNYRQSLLLISEIGDVLGDLRKIEGFDEKSIYRWLNEEEEYLSGLAKEPEEDTLAVAYVEALIELVEAE